jgi:surface polysaccharide O-acyltransferase-like enzyme
VQRKLYLDILRIVAIFGVILIHVASLRYNEFSNLSLAEWLPHNVFHSLVRWCVPVFFMMSGALLLPKKESVKAFFTKRYLRLLIAFLFWQVFYFWYVKNFPDLRTGAGWYQLLMGEGAYHLWFMGAILQVYLLVPFLQRVVQKISRPVILYGILVWLAAVAGVRLLQVFTTGAPLSYHLSERYLLDYGGFLLLGYYIDQIQLRKKYNWWLGLIIVAVSAFNIWLKWFWHGSVHSYADSNLSILIIVQAVAVFLWCKNHEEWWQKIFSKRKTARVLQSLVAGSFGIYLVHLIGLYLFQKNHYLDGGWPNGWLGVPLASILLFLICWLVVTIGRKIPILKRLVA